MLNRIRLFAEKKATARTALIPALLFFGAIMIVLLYPLDTSAGGHGDSGELEHKVNLENQSGINLIIARLYNDHRLLFALTTTITMAVVGIIIGQLTGILLKFLGLK